MKPGLICLLSCPQGRFRPCGGAFAIQEYTSVAGEIMDGFLTCRKCRRVFPILQGIPMLVNDVNVYIKNNYTHIIEAVGSPDKIHRKVLAYLDAIKQKEPSRPGYNGIAAGAGYYLYHYSDVGAFDHPLFMADLVAHYRQNNTTFVIQKWLEQTGPVGGTALDLGCNVGGLTHLLAETCHSAIGIDLSFADLLNAAKITKHLPEKRDSFIMLVGDQEYNVPINLDAVENIEYIVAAADNMPVKHSFAIILAKNIIDIVPSNGRVLKEIERLLSARGDLFLSFVPYLSSITIEKERMLPLTGDSVKDYMSIIKFYEEHTSIPFLLMHSGNHFEVFSNTCLLGRKES